MTQIEHMFNDIEFQEEPQLPTLQIDGLVLVAIALAAYMAFYVAGQILSIPGRGAASGSSLAAAAIDNSLAANSSANSMPTDQQDSGEVYAAVIFTAPSTADPYTFVAPYERYTLTQGLHGQSYGHLAIDLAAGRGSAILSPINGTISQVDKDQYGNTTLVIENEVYQVLMLHGDYTVSPGDEVRIGDLVGTESNHGYTMDMAGRLCNGARGCGNHTHLNVYDKIQGINVNPMSLIGY